MRLGVFTTLLHDMTLDEALGYLADRGIHAVELGTGNYPGDKHCSLTMLEEPAALDAFRGTLDKHGASITALSCHGNPLHPDRGVALHADQIALRTLELAATLGVKTVVEFSGCPGDSLHAVAPNWVTCPWPSEYADVLAWQWEEVVEPYWKEHAKRASDLGIRIAIEMHPGFVVYSPETMLRLRSIAGDTVGVNLDPSHLFWQIIDPLQAVRELNGCIYHVHAKDTEFYPANLARCGVLDTKPYTDAMQRGWMFRTCGYGHDAGWWKAFISALRIAGYDGFLSIEHEDSMMSPREGLEKAISFLSGIVIETPPGAAYWI